MLCVFFTLLYLSLLTPAAAVVSPSLGLNLMISSRGGVSKPASKAKKKAKPARAKAVKVTQRKGKAAKKTETKGMLDYFRNSIVTIFGYIFRWRGKAATATEMKAMFKYVRISMETILGLIFIYLGEVGQERIMINTSVGLAMFGLLLFEISFMIAEDQSMIFGAKMFGAAMLFTGLLLGIEMI